MITTTLKEMPEFDCQFVTVHEHQGAAYGTTFRKTGDKIEAFNLDVPFQWEEIDFEETMGDVNIINYTILDAE